MNKHSENNYFIYLFRNKSVKAITDEISVLAIFILMSIIQKLICW